MRAALWFMSLFALAVGGAWLVGHNIGTVTLYWPPYRVDVSLNLVLLGLVLLLLVWAVVQRAVLALLAMPKQAKQWRQQQKERAAYGALLDALTHFMAGRYVRSRKAAELAVEKEAAYQREEDARLSHASALRTLAHLTAADAAHALQDRAAREQHAQAAQHAIDQAAPVLRQALQEGVDLRAARWALNDRDAEGSLQRLEAMPSALARRVVALRMRLKAARLAGQTGKALDTALLLVKHKAFSADVASSLVRSLVQDWLQRVHEPQAVAAIWRKLGSAERQRTELVVACADRWLALGGDAAVARQWLETVWFAWAQNPSRDLPAQSVLLALSLERALTAGASADTREWLAKLETAQRAQPRHAALQYVVGMLCLHHQLWGKAQTHLQSAVAQLPAPLKARAWQRLAEMAEHRGDQEAAMAAWKAAAQAM
jgi:HemY protein